MKCKIFVASLFIQLLLLACQNESSSSDKDINCDTINNLNSLDSIEQLIYKYPDYCVKTISNSRIQKQVKYFL